MVRDTDTRQRVVQAAAELFRRQGYHATGLNQILELGQAPKGSLYFHFPGGKEQLAAEAISLSGSELSEVFDVVLGAAPAPNVAIVQLAELLASMLEASDYREGCPIATVALDASADSDAIRTACDGAYRRWLETAAGHFRSWGVTEGEAWSLATLVLSSFEGALVRARVQCDVAVVRSVAQMLGDLVDEAIYRG